jgi:hypothetical protein
MPIQPLSERFWSKVVKTSTCWIWTAATNKGYGRFQIGGRTFIAPRVSYWLKHGHIDKDLCIDHLCRNPPCVNPDHLELVSRGENALRGETFTARNKAKTHCNKGHEFSEKNTRITMEDGRPVRVCRACKNISKSNQILRAKQRRLG